MSSKKPELSIIIPVALKYKAKPSPKYKPKQYQGISSI